MTDLKAKYVDYLMTWPWEWAGTLTFRTYAAEYTANRRLRLWVRDLCKAEGLQVALKGVFNFLRHPHLHVLLFGKNRFGEGLNKADCGNWERKWPGIAKIQPIYDRKGACEYLVANMPRYHHSLVSYNKKLLIKSMKGVSI
jgi:hypothetical protein